MPRQPRSRLGQTYWHVISRGNRRQDIFEEESDWGRFKASILDELSTEGAILIALCLMTNHFHLVTPTDIGLVSRALHRVLTSHATYMNKKYGRTGHLFGDRFKSYPCDPELGLKPLVRYVHLNPVRAGLVRTPEEWAWSSHRDYLTLGSANPSGRTLLLDRFGQDESSSLKAYQAYMAPSQQPRSDKPGNRVSLAMLAAHFEREGGHRPGLLKERSQRHDLFKTLKRFIDAAIAEGYSAKEIADYLCVSPATVYHRRRTD